MEFANNYGTEFDELDNINDRPEITSETGDRELPPARSYPDYEPMGKARILHGDGRIEEIDDE